MFSVGSGQCHMLPFERNQMWRFSLQEATVSFSFSSHLPHRFRLEDVAATGFCLEGANPTGSSLQGQLLRCRIEVSNPSV